MSVGCRRLRWTVYLIKILGVDYLPYASNAISKRSGKGNQFLDNDTMGGLYLKKRLLSIKEVCEYIGWGKTKVREILNRPSSTFTIRMGNRLYADKKKFNVYLEDLL